MLKFLQKSVLAKPLLVGLLLLAPAATAVASEVDTQDVDLATDELGQVTSVSQLSDVYPTDWAFQAVQSLVERYGCIAGYPNGTFRGNNKATRYEMAAALNACLDQISDRFASKAVIDTVKALQAEFAAELATLRGRVDGLEARVATVEAQQFSTTTKLKGEVVFTAGYVADEDDPLDSVLGVDTDGGNTASDRVFLGHRARLNFQTSFNGKDLLRTRIESRNIPVLTGGGSAGVENARLSIDGGFGNNDITLNELFYKFKPSDDLTLKLAIVGGDYKDDAYTFNPIKSSATGALSRFFRFNPAVYRAPGGTTLSGVYEISDKVDFALVFAADDAESPVADDGNFLRGGICCGGEFGVFAQLGFEPIKKVRVGLTFARNEYKGNGPDITGGVADAPVTVGVPGLAGIFASEDTSEPFGDDFDTTTNNVGLQLEAKISDGLIFSGWSGLTFASSRDARNEARAVAGFENANSEVRLINWAANLIFPDLFAEGNRGSISVGMPPFIFDSGDLGIDDGQNPTIMGEAQYQFKVSKNIKLSTGVIVILRANNTDSNDPIIVPVIRTTFKF